MPDYEQVIIDLARFEREALETIRRKLASRQTGEPEKDYESETFNLDPDRPASPCGPGVGV